MELDHVLDQVDRAIDSHDLATAERLLEPVIHALGALDTAPADQRCRALLSWGWLHGAAGRYPRARLTLEEAARIADAEHLAPLLAEALREVGLVARYAGDFAEADSLLARAALVSAQYLDTFGIARATFYRATVAHLRGHLTLARTLIEEAADLATALERSPGSGGAQVKLLRADICREAAVSSRMARDYDAARRHLARAHELYLKLGRRVGAANSLRELGAVETQIGDDEAARRHYVEAFAIYMRARRRTGAAAIARRLGYLDMLAGTIDPRLFDRADRRLRQSLRLGGDEPTNAAAVALLRARAARLRGHLDDAEALIEESARLYLAIAARAGGTGDGSGLGLQPGMNRNLSETALEAGFLARDRNRQDEAMEHFGQALALLDEAEDPGAASLAHYALGTELIQKDHVEDALQHAVQSFILNEESGHRLADPQDRRTYYRQHHETYALALHCAARAGDGRTALAVATASASEALAAFVRAGARLSPDLHDLMEKITLTEAGVERRGADERTAALAEAESLYAELENRTSWDLRRHLTSRRPAVDDLLASLPPEGHALVLQAFDQDDRICYRIHAADGHVTVDELQMSVDTRRFLDSYHRAATGAAWEHQEHQLAALGEVAVPPRLAAALEEAESPPQLVVCTGNLLGPVPVAALRIRDRYLAQVACLSIVPSLDLWHSLRGRLAAVAGHGVLAYLDPALPGAVGERKALEGALSPVTWTTPRELRARLTQARGYAAVVIAAHGSQPVVIEGHHFDGEARAGLAQALTLAPGDHLTAADLLGADLPAGLITASCWSGRLSVQAATETLGIPTVALIAGARWVLAGTVDVGGVTSMRLMTTFYERLARGTGPAQALHDAQCQFLARRPVAPPGAWAGLAIVGDGFGGTCSAPTV